MKVKKNTSMNKKNSKKRTTVFVLINDVKPSTIVLCAAED